MCWIAIVTEAPFGMPIFSFSRSLGALHDPCASSEHDLLHAAISLCGATL